jgi:hypothetical protein
MMIWISQPNIESRHGCACNVKPFPNGPGPLLRETMDNSISPLPVNLEFSCHISDFAPEAVASLGH